MRLPCLSYHGLIVAIGCGNCNIRRRKTVLQVELYGMSFKEDKMQSCTPMLALHQVGH